MNRVDLLGEFYERRVEHVHYHRTHLDYPVNSIVHLSAFCPMPCPIMDMVDQDTLGWTAIYGEDGSVKIDIADQSNLLVQEGSVTAFLVRDNAGDRIETTYKRMETMTFTESTTAEIDYALIRALVSV